jgi:hypothetical protein
VIRGAPGVIVLCIAAFAPHCLGHGTRGLGPVGTAPVPLASAARFQVAETIYDGGLRNGWQHSGKAQSEIATDRPARVRFGEDDELVFAKPGLMGDYGGVAFRVQTPRGEGEFLEVRVQPSGGGPLRAVKVSPDHRSELGDGWTEVVIPMDQLNPARIPFEALVFRAFRPLGAEWVLFDKISLTSAVVRAAPTPQITTKRASMRIACDERATKISALIYGVAGVDARHVPADVGATVYRWGGNVTSTYNWERHVANRARDWFFENRPCGDYAEFLANNASDERLSALTVPILGWVAKDATSYSFPVSVYGPQQKTDPWIADAGNGDMPSGAPIVPGPPSRTSFQAPPEWVKRWILAIRANDAKSGKRGVAEYILDNEPMIWNTTHRDVRPEPLGYDELLDRTIQYGKAIREADPGAVIAGPAEWGWTNYFFSAKDAAAGFSRKPDRRAHENLPLVEWYLRKLREYEQKTGTRILDLLDLHYYPQAKNVYSDAADRPTGVLRLSATRSLWDPSYIDESWINDTVRLLPRMREWIERNYPGRGMSIGEWNFGGEKDITGALATAEALGRFAQFGVTSAFYWTVPPAGSPSIQGFLAYRNFDGKGGRFLDWYVPTTTDPGVSLFASRDEEGKHLVAVAINMSPDNPLVAKIDLGACGSLASHQAYAYGRGGPGFVASERVQDNATTFDQLLLPWSITVIDLQLAPTGPR